MSDDLDTPSLRRFARDLRRIREDRDVPLASIQDETQVHSSYLESFEAGTLHEQARMNEVYLKAFVRAYAEAIGLSPKNVVEHLALALSGTYDGQLAAAFLDTPPNEDASQGGATDEDPPQEERTEEEKTEAQSLDPADDAQDRAPSDRASPPASSDAMPPSADPEEEAPPSQARDSSSAKHEATSTEAKSPSGSEREEGLRSSSDSPSGTSGPKERSRPRDPSSTPAPVRGAVSFLASVWAFVQSHRTGVLLAVGGVFVLALGGVLGGYFTEEAPSSSASIVKNEPPESTPASDAPASAVDPSPDTGQSESQSRPPPANIVLGDTLHVTVRAVADVRELRVQQDDNLRRPYWIEAGDARVFPFAERITIQNQLDSLQLLLEGHPYPTDRTDEEGRVIIRRDTAQQFADTLRGAPASLPETPDTIRGAASVPSDTLSPEGSTEP